MAFTVNKRAFCVLEFAKTESIMTVHRRFRIMYHTEPPTDKTIHVPFTNCFVCRWFCVVHDPKPPLHSHNDSVLQIPRHRTLSYSLWMTFFVSHDYLLAVESGSTPWPLVQKKLGEILYLLIWRDSLPIDMLLSAMSVLVVAQSSLEIPEGLMNNPVFSFCLQVLHASCICSVIGEIVWPWCIDVLCGGWWDDLKAQYSDVSS